jgi:precorrin-2 dehydrogenase/sirohydrochlorin ferrochelatase
MTMPPDAPPPFYPVLLDLRGVPCLVVGGGAVACRKVAGLHEAGARVTVIAPAVGTVPAGVTVHRRGYAPGDVAGARLVFAATDDPAVNARVAADARAAGAWVNVADNPDAGDLVLPAVTTRGALRIAVSTGGASPALARRIREALDAAYGAEYGELVQLLWRLRRDWEPRAMAGGVPGPRRRRAWEAVLDLPLLDTLRAGDAAAAECAAQAVLDAALQETRDAQAS